MMHRTLQILGIILLVSTICNDQQFNIDAFAITIISRSEISLSSSSLFSSISLRDDDNDQNCYDRICLNTVWKPLDSWKHVGCHFNSITIKQNGQKQQQQPQSMILPTAGMSPTTNTNRRISDKIATSCCSLSSQSQSNDTAQPKKSPLSVLSSILPIPRKFCLQRPTFLSTNYLPTHQQQQTQRFSNGSTTSLITKSALTSSITKQYASATAYDNNNGLSPCNIKVVGVGGGGCNAIDRMLDMTIGSRTGPTQTTTNEIDYWALNTDSQVISRSKLRGANTMQIGTSVTRGLGAGGNPDVGRMAAEESRQEIRHMIDNCDLCFITAGMGGGTGSGAAPVVARVAKEMGCLTIGIVTKPFAFEGKRRMTQALNAMDELRKYVDTIIVVSNDRLLEIIPDDTPLDRAFCVADDILRQGVIGITDIILQPGLINVDFADVRTIMSNAGTALMGIGVGSGDNAAEDAAMAAISSPLLDATIDNAKGVVFNISGGPKLTLNEVNKAAKLIYKFVAPDANVIFGALVDESMGDNISITVLAAGFDEEPIPNSYISAQSTQGSTDTRTMSDNKGGPYNNNNGNPTNSRMETGSNFPEFFQERG